MVHATSSLIAFCSQKEHKRHDVEQFQHLLVRLMSMLYCAALQQVAVVEDQHFDIIDNTGIDDESLLFLARSVDRCEIILQWIQRAIVDANHSLTVDIPPPILSRTFQELSRGIVNLNNARKIKEIPFPFPYAQVSTAMLLVHLVMTPIFASQFLKSTTFAVLITLVTTASFWALNYIAQELEQPFGEDKNDLPMAEMQNEMNRSLSILLQPLAQQPPRFVYDRDREMNMAVRGSNLDVLVRESCGLPLTTTRVSLTTTRVSSNQEANPIDGKTCCRRPCSTLISVDRPSTTSMASSVVKTNSGVKVGIPTSYKSRLQSLRAGKITYLELLQYDAPSGDDCVNVESMPTIEIESHHNSRSPPLGLVGEDDSNNPVTMTCSI